MEDVMLDEDIKSAIALQKGVMALEEQIEELIKVRQTLNSPGKIGGNTQRLKRARTRLEQKKNLLSALVEGQISGNIFRSPYKGTR